MIKHCTTADAIKCLLENTRRETKRVAKLICIQLLLKCGITEKYSCAESVRISMLTVHAVERYEDEMKGRKCVCLYVGELV